ncbi:MAG: carbon monoxide dehydrogenase subunit G [Rhodovibrionaceae bacterium]|nr:carbon monoxide dehydrogenase subunit G [Rhodovibrionaceae bacterium]
MELKGEYRIKAPRQKVWDALNDPDVLRQSIPGCEELEQTADNEFTAKVKAKVGPVNSKFGGKVTLSDINAPESYKISGEGSGGAAGFAKGSADVHLAEEGDATVLTYNADAQVGGKLAQIGSRLVQGTARKMADQFFGNFAQQVGASVEKPGEGELAEEAEGAKEEETTAEAQAPAPEAAGSTEEAEASAEKREEEDRAASTGPSEEEEQKIAEETSRAAERGAALGHSMPEGPTGGAGPGEKGGETGGKRIPMIGWVGGVIALVIVLLLIFGM